MVEEKKDETKKEELEKEGPEKEEQKLVLSTTKSIHEPIEIEIDGKTYQNNPFSRATFDKVKKHEEAALKGDTEALYKQVQALYPVSMEVLNKIDIRDINSIIQHTMTQIFKTAPTSEKEKAGKNVPKPGSKESASSPASSQAS